MVDARKTKTRVAVLFGGRSVEHEISVITALEIIDAMDVVLFEPIPVYIDSRGRWFTGQALRERDLYKKLPSALNQLVEVTLLPIPGVRGLVPRLRSGNWASERDRIPIDVVIPAFHGQFGEDGCMQGLLELAELAYVGCDVLASSVAMHKYLCKSVLRAHGIPVLPAVVVEKSELRADLDGVHKRIVGTPGLDRFPLFVKPCNLGSSIGVSRAHNRAELEAALAKVFKYDLEAIVEPCVTELMEINVSVCEDSPTRLSVVEIPVSQTGVLTYEDKYLRGGGGKKGGGSRGMASLVRVVDPPDLDPSYKEQVQLHARTAFEVLGCAGVVRFDFMVDTSSGELYFNELNPFPGSLAYYLWAKSLPPRLYTETITHMIVRAESRRAQTMSLARDMGFRALFS